MNKNFLASALLAALLPAQLVHSATLTAVQSGEWTDAATWGGAVPGYADDRVIPNGITVRVGSIVNAGGSTSVFGTLDIYREGLYNGGLLENQNTLLVSFGGFLYMQPGATLINRSTMFCGYACRFYEGTVINESGAVIDNTDELQAALHGTLVNAGVIRNSGSTFVLASSGGFSNGPTAMLINFAGSSATLDGVDNYGRIDNLGSMITGVVENHAGYFVNGGTLEARGVITNKSGAQLQNSGTWNGTWGSGIVNEDGGFMFNGGGPAANLFVGDATYSYVIENRGFFTNAGNFVVARGVFYNLNSFSNSGGQLLNQATVYNEGSVSIYAGNFQNNAYFRNNGAVGTVGGGSFTNGGLVDNYGYVSSDSFVNNATFQDYGSLDGSLKSIVNNGTINLYCGSNFYPGDNGLIGNPPLDHCPPPPSIATLIALAQQYGVNTAVLGQAAALYGDVNFRNNVAVCNKLNAFGNQLRANRTLDPLVFNALMNLRSQVAVLIGCTS